MSQRESEREKCDYSASVHRDRECVEPEFVRASDESRHVWCPRTWCFYLSPIQWTSITCSSYYAQLVWQRRWSTRTFHQCPISLLLFHILFRAPHQLQHRRWCSRTLSLYIFYSLRNCYARSGLACMCVCGGVQGSIRQKSRDSNTMYVTHSSAFDTDPISLLSRLNLWPCKPYIQISRKCSTTWGVLSAMI